MNNQAPGAPVAAVGGTKAEKKAIKKAKLALQPKAPVQPAPVVAAQQGAAVAKRACIYNLRHHYGIRDPHGVAYTGCSHEPCSKLHFEEAKKKLSKVVVEKHIKDSSNDKYNFPGSDELIAKVRADSAFK